MKKWKQWVVVATLICTTFTASSQSYDPFIENVINGIHIDSLVSYVRILSGEDSVTIEGSRELIKSRSSFQSSERALAAQYLFETLAGYGLNAQEHNYSSSGKNILAKQPGNLNPEKQFIICAHYDAVTSYAADDNASGTATVLEAARILSQYELPCTIIYALWDQEEGGLIGSQAYAIDAALNGDQIEGVINIDMIGWDGDEDMKIELHTKPIGNTAAIADILIAVDELYGLSLVPVIYNPGTTASDHASFWQQNYGALLLIEEYFGGDFNPYYHSPNDRISEFNETFFLESARLAIASLATMADNNPVTDIKPAILTSNYQIRNYPNPFSTSTILDYYQPQNSQASILLHNSYGSMTKTLFDEFQEQGSYQLTIEAADLPVGLYFVVVNSSAGRQTHKIMVVR